MTQHSSASKMMLTRITSRMVFDLVSPGFTSLVEEFLVVLDEDEGTVWAEEEVVEGRVLVVGMLVEFGVREELDGGELVAREV